MSTSYLLKCLRVLIIVSACTYDNEYKALTWQGKRIEIIKYIDWEDVDEPCKGDTPA